MPGVTSSIINAISTSGRRHQVDGTSRRVSIDSILQNVTKRKSSSTSTPSALFVSSSNNSSNSSNNSMSATSTADSASAAASNKNSNSNSSATTLKRKSVQFVDDDNLTTTTVIQRIPRKKKKSKHHNNNNNNNNNNNTRQEDEEKGGELPPVEDTSTATQPQQHKSVSSSSSSTMMTVVQVTNIPDGANKSGIEMLIDMNSTTTTTSHDVSTIEVRDDVATIKLTTTDQARQMAQNLDGCWWGGGCVKARVVMGQATANTTTATSPPGTTSTSPPTSFHHHQQQQHQEYHDHHCHGYDDGYGGHVVYDNGYQQESTQTAGEQPYYEQQQDHQHYQQDTAAVNEDDYSYYGHGYEDNGKGHGHYGHYGYEDNGSPVSDHHQLQQLHRNRDQYSQAVNPSTHHHSKNANWISREDFCVEIHGIVKPPHLDAVIPPHLQGFEEIKADVSEVLFQYCNRHGLKVQIVASNIWINRTGTATARKQGWKHNVYSGLFHFQNEVQMQQALECLRAGIMYCGKKLAVLPRVGQRQPIRDRKYGPVAAAVAAAEKHTYHQADDRAQLLLRTEENNRKVTVSSNCQDRAAVYVTYVNRTASIDELASFLVHSLNMDGVTCQPDILHCFFHGTYHKHATAYVEFDNFDHAAALETMGRRGALTFMHKKLRVSRWQRTLPPSIRTTFRSYYLPPRLHRPHPSHTSEQNSGVGESHGRQLTATHAADTSRIQNDGAGSVGGHDTSHDAGIEQGLENPANSKHHCADSSKPDPCLTESRLNDQNYSVDDSEMTSETAEARVSGNAEHSRSSDGPSNMSIEDERQWGDTEPSPSPEPGPNTILKMEELAEKQLQDIIELRLRIEILSDERNESLTGLREDVEVLTGQLNGIRQRHNQAVQSLMSLTVANREEKQELKTAIEQERRKRLLKEQELETIKNEFKHECDTRENVGTS